MLTLPRRPSDWLAYVLAALGLALALGAAVVAVQLARTAMDVSSEPLRDIELPLPGRTPGTGAAGILARGEPMNILLLGYGGLGVEGGYLTDSIMVVAIDPAADTVTLISIPRDLFITLPATRYTRPYAAKINEAFFLGAAFGDRDEGIRAADEAVEAVLGIQIHRTVAVDFAAFRAAIAALGGIEVDVERAFTAQYPRSDDPADTAWITIHFDAGPQHMDAETALRYARARHAVGIEGSDFARAQRQQRMLVAVKDRVLATEALPTLLGLLDTLRENVRTDLSLSDMHALAEFARGHDDTRTYRAALTDANVLRPVLSDTHGYILVPRAEGWGEVHAFVRRATEFAASLDEHVDVIITASSARIDVARILARRLGEMGLAATTAISSGADPAQSVVEGAPGSATAAFLVEHLGARLEPSTQGGIVIRLGQQQAAATDRPLPTPAPTPEPEAEEDPPQEADDEDADEQRTQEQPAQATPTPPPTGAP